MELVIELNGAPRALPPGTTLHALIAGLGLDGKRIAVAVNREVVGAARWPERTLSAADRVEVVVAIGGG